jgi:hypothetical protein
MKPVLEQMKRNALGAGGEFAVEFLSSHLGLPFIADVYMPFGSIVTQIDGMAIMNGRIVVMETKNWGHVVRGNPVDPQWTQHIRGGGTRKLYNPFKQNELHLSAVNQFLGRSDLTDGLVMLVGEASFPDGMPAGMIRLKDLLDARPSGSISEPGLQTAWDRLKTYARTCDRSELRTRHAASIASWRAKRT